MQKVHEMSYAVTDDISYFIFLRSICYLYRINLCVYNEIIQSLEKLLDQSAMDLDKRPAVGHDSPGKVSECQDYL